MFNFGVEGTSYNLESGYPRYTPELMRNPQGLPPAQAMRRYIRGNFNGPFVQDPRYLEQYIVLQRQKDALKTWLVPVDDRQIPPVLTTQEYNGKLSSLIYDVLTKHHEAVS